MRAGPLMAASDTAEVIVRGRGGHASRPHLAADPVVAASAIVMALQTVISRSVDPTQTAVITIGTIHGGTAGNVIPDEVPLGVSMRWFSAEIRALLQRRLNEVSTQQAAIFRCTAEVVMDHGNPVVLNTPYETALATQVVQAIVGPDKVIECERIPGSGISGISSSASPAACCASAMARRRPCYTTRPMTSRTQA